MFIRVRCWLWPHKVPSNKRHGQEVIGVFVVAFVDRHWIIPRLQNVVIIKVKNNLGSFLDGIKIPDILPREVLPWDI